MRMKLYELSILLNYLDYKFNKNNLFDPIKINYVKKIIKKYNLTNEQLKKLCERKYKINFIK